MTKYILIRADTNDADYIEELNIISDTQVDIIIDILSKINKDSSGTISWKTLDVADEELWEQHPELTVEECEILDTYVPSGEYGIHTIESIEIYEVKSIQTLL